MKKQVIIIVEPDLSYQLELKGLLKGKDVLKDIDLLSPEIEINKYADFAAFIDDLFNRTVQLVKKNDSTIGVLVDIKLNEKSDLCDGIDFAVNLKRKFTSLPIINITQHFRGNDIYIFSEASFASDGVIPKEYFAKKDFSKKDFLDLFKKAKEKIETIQITNSISSNLDSLKKYDDVKVAIISALYDDEFQSIEDFLEDKENIAGFETLKVAKLKGSDKRVFVDFQSNMGMVEATYLTTQIVSNFDIKYIIMIGVCGGRYSKKVKILDLIIPNKIFDYQTGKYENGKFMPYLRTCNVKNKKVVSYSNDILKKMEQCDGLIPLDRLFNKLKCIC